MSARRIAYLLSRDDFKKPPVDSPADGSSNGQEVIGDRFDELETVLSNPSRARRPACRSSPAGSSWAIWN